MKTEYDSSDYAPTNIKASELTDKGVDFVYNGMRSEEGKFGTFYVLDAKVEGEDTEILFSSKKLATIFHKHGADFMGKELNLAGYGNGVNRGYKVRIVQQTL